MKKELSRQRKEQIRNIELGMCYAHRKRPIYRGDKCLECWDRYRKRARSKKLNPTDEEWLSVDFLESNESIAKKLNVGIFYVSSQRKRITGKCRSELLYSRVKELELQLKQNQP